MMTDSGESSALGAAAAGEEPATGAAPRPVPAATLAAVAERMASADTVLLTCHRGPDGDAVGSIIALGELLRAAGKSVVLYNPDPVPRRYKWLPLAKTFVRKLKKAARFAITIVVDCADAKLLGTSFPDAEVTGTLIVLDHHSATCPFGDLYLCDPEASSVGVLVARIAAHLGWSINADAALGLYLSLVCDTGSFRYANTNPEALRLAAELIEIGVDPADVSERLYERSSRARYRLLAAALGTLEFELDGRVALMTITREMLKQTGATWEETTDLVNYTRGLASVECGVLLTPAKRGGARLSLRSKGKVDAGAWSCGMVAGLIHDIPTCRELIQGIMNEAASLIQDRLGGMLADMDENRLADA